MNGRCIYNIDLMTNSNNIFSISSDNFDHFYIANIDDDGNEQKYNCVNDNTTLNANFFMIRLINDKNSNVDSIIKLLNEYNDITSIKVCFTNGTYQNFELSKKRILNSGKIINACENHIIEDKNLCILIADKKIRYIENLFV